MAGLLTNANYINSTIKPAIKSAIEAQGVTVPSTDSFLDYADRIGEIEGGGSGYQLKDLPSGSISTVNDAAPLPLNALKVSVEAWQEGSGTPSPSNIRPIHGWDSGEITACDDVQSPTQTETTTLDFPQTIYGAEWDVAGGGMAKGYGFEVFDGSDDEGWLVSFGRMIVRRDNILFNDNAVTIDSNELTPIPNTTEWSKIVKGTITVSKGGDIVQIMVNHNTDNQTTETLAEFKAWLANNPLQVRYKLATPVPIDLSPLSIRMLEGTNNLYADCGEVLEGEYFVDEGAIDVRKVDYSIGSNSALKISDGRILQGFASMSGYHARPLDASGNWLDVDWSKDFEIGSAFKASSLSGNTTIFGCGVSGSMNYAPNLYFYQGSTAYITLSEDGSSSAVDTALNYTFQTDTWYFVRAKFTKSTLNLKIEVSTDMSNFTTAYNDTLAAAPYHDAAAISIGGMAESANYASNSILIDLYNTYIKDDSGSIVWGASTGVFPS